MFSSAAISLAIIQFKQAHSDYAKKRMNTTKDNENNICSS